MQSHDPDMIVPNLNKKEINLNLCWGALNKGRLKKSFLSLSCVCVGGGGSVGANYHFYLSI